MYRWDEIMKELLEIEFAYNFYKLLQHVNTPVFKLFSNT